MVTKIVERIGEEIKLNSPYFDTGEVNAVQLPIGKVVTKKDGEDEGTDVSINDHSGVGFYIRVEPKATVSKNRKPLSSCASSYTAKQICHLVAYNFEILKDVDNNKWVSKLAKILSMSAETLEIKSTNASYIDNYIEETKQKFNVTRNFNCVKVIFEVSYDIDLVDCDFCDIQNAPCDDVPANSTYYVQKERCFWS